VKFTLTDLGLVGLGLIVAGIVSAWGDLVAVRSLVLCGLGSVLLFIHLVRGD
jgi:hypothetical protein